MPTDRKHQHESRPAPRRTSSIRFRITASLIVAILLTLGSTALLVDSRIDREVAQRADVNLLERAQALADIFKAKNEASGFPDNHIPPFLADDGTVYFLIDCEGRHVKSSAEAERLAWPTPDANQPRFADLADPKGTALRATVIHFQPTQVAQRGVQNFSPPNDNVAGPCTLRMAINHGEVVAFQRSMDKIEIACVVLGFLAVVTLAPLLVTRGLRPLSKLAGSMREIGPDSPGTRLDGAKARELVPLVQRFNEVLARMETGLLRERQFASGVAHELRTPLAELRTSIEIELRYPSGRGLSEVLTDVAAIGNEMERLVSALLLLTRIEAGIEQVQWEMIDMAPLTTRLLERYQDRIRARGLSLQTSIAATVVCWADAALLEVVFNNLLGNAIAYAPSGSEISLSCTDGRWCIQNLAPELNDDDIARMGQRFWRKGRDAGVNTGLGLVLAAAAASAQSMRLVLDLQGQHLQASLHYPSFAIHAGRVADSLELGVDRNHINRD